MDPVWFCGNDGSSVGPLTIKELRTAIARRPTPSKVKVWRAGFSDFRDADQVEELNDLFSRPEVGVTAALPPDFKQSQSANAIPRGPANLTAWKTLGWVLGGIAIFEAFPFAVAFVHAFAKGVAEGLSGHASQQPDNFMRQSWILAAIEVATVISVVPYYRRAARKSGLNAAQYLGLKAPAAGRALIGLAVVTQLVIVRAIAAAAYYGPVPLGHVPLVLRAAPLDVVLFTLAVVALAPIHEEIAFRGFALPGIARDWGAFAAILISTMLWTLLHVGQEDLFGLGALAVVGANLAWLRLWSGSTFLTIGLHALYNLFGVVLILG